VIRFSQVAVRVVAPAVVVAAAVVGACTQVSSDPSAVVALEFDSLPYPAVVGGDTLRDETGAVIPLHAAALNADGQVIASAGITYVLLDTGATVSSEGIFTSTAPNVQSVRVLAQAGTLQSRPLTIMVTPRPDSMVADGTVDTLRYKVIDDVSNTSGPVTVKILSNTASPPVPVRGWIVRFTLEHAGTPIATDNTSLAWMVDDANRRSFEDTTGTDGRASRKVRFNSKSLTQSQAFDDSLVVIAQAYALGAALKGSPVRIVVQLRSAGS